MIIELKIPQSRGGQYYTWKAQQERKEKKALHNNDESLRNLFSSCTTSSEFFFFFANKEGAGTEPEPEIIMGSIHL